MKKPPPGWPQITPALYYNDASAAIDWLCRVFGFEVRLKVEGEGGKIAHSELEYGEGLIMIGEADRPDPKGQHRTSPKAVRGLNSQSLCVVVDDADAHCARARAEGATIAIEPATQDYGGDYWADRTYEAVDLEGHHWWFMQRVRDQKSRADK